MIPSKAPGRPFGRRGGRSRIKPKRSLRRRSTSVIKGLSRSARKSSNGKPIPKDQEATLRDGIQAISVPEGRIVPKRNEKQTERNTVRSQRDKRTEANLRLGRLPLQRSPLNPAMLSRKQSPNRSQLIAQPSPRPLLRIRLQRCGRLLLARSRVLPTP